MSLDCSNRLLLRRNETLYNYQDNRKVMFEVIPVADNKFFVAHEQTGRAFPINNDKLELEVKELEEVLDFAAEIRARSDDRWLPPQPSSDAYIWRYLNFTQLLSILERDEIWFNNVNLFDDPYEGSIPQANLEAEVDEIVSEFDISRNAATSVHQTTLQVPSFTVSGAYVNCWNVNEHQSAALWEQYVDSAEGIAIRTTVDRLHQALEGNEYDLVYGEVEYIDYDHDNIPEGDYPAIYHKRESFEHENEFRVSIISREEIGESENGFYAEVDTETLLDRIVISPMAPGWFSDLVQRTLNTYNLDCELKESGLYSDPDVMVK